MYYCCVLLLYVLYLEEVQNVCFPTVHLRADFALMSSFSDLCGTSIV